MTSSTVAATVMPPLFGGVTSGAYFVTQSMARLPIQLGHTGRREQGGVAMLCCIK
jgi:hypothetical protein